MSPKALALCIKILVTLMVVLTGAIGWYYTFGRKPKLILSTKLVEKDGSPSAHLLAPGEVLLLVGAKATLYELASGQQRWSASLSAPAPMAPAAAATPRPAPKSTPPPAAPAEKVDALLVKRVERRFAKLQTWSDKLAKKRATLKTPMQIEAFNIEAAKYHAELTAARAEAAPLHKAAPAAAALAITDLGPPSPRLLPAIERWAQKTEVLAEGASVWILQGQRAVALDRANGRALKEIALAGDLERTWRGKDCFYILVTGGDGARSVMRVDAAGAVQKIAAGPAALERFQREEGQPPSPNLQPHRTEFSAAGDELVQADIRLIERKITERQVISGDRVSEMEEADKKTTGGGASDAAFVAATLARDAARDATGGGKERVDESTYEVTLRRPFAPGTPAAAPIRVQGRPEIFSTATLDLVVGGQTLVAFDRALRKTWESKLAHPLAFADSDDDSAAAGPRTATRAHPCLEDGGRLFLFDKAFVSAFDSATGKALWRLASIGIQKAQLDAGDTLYLSSANGSAESLKHAALANTEPQLLKVEAATGKIRWKLDKYQDCFISGGNLYATRETRNGEDAVNAVFDRSKAPQCRFKLYKLSTRDGAVQWEWFQTRRPLRIACEGKKVSLLFADELQVLKSIAL